MQRSRVLQRGFPPVARSPTDAGIVTVCGPDLEAGRVLPVDLHTLTGVKRFDDCRIRHDKNHALAEKFANDAA